MRVEGRGFPEFAMANFDPRNGHFQAFDKDFSYGETQQRQETSCPRRINEGTEAFEISDFLVLDDDFNNSCKSKDAGDQDDDFSTVKSRPGIPREYPRSFSNNPRCIQGIHLENNSTVTFELTETM